MTESVGAASGATVQPAQTPEDRLKEQVEAFVAQTVELTDVMLEPGRGDAFAMLAVSRAYYAVYGVAVSSAVLLGIDLAPFQNQSDHHIKNHAVPHTQVPVLASHLQNLRHPPKTLGPGARSPEATATFSLVRALQKLRKSADYMGTETVSAERGRRYVDEAKELCDQLWRYTREHVG